MITHVSFSGGLDSTALLYRAISLRGPKQVRAVSINYGQRHARELAAAKEITDLLGVRWATLDLRGLLAGSSLIDSGEEVPEGHYAEATMTATVVNGRNLLFAAAIIAQTQPGDEVWLGVHAGDHFIYPDCRPEFVAGLAAAARAYDVTVRAPWVEMSKAEVVAAERDAPLGLSWSCYKGGEVHCGRCGTCVERAEAFALAGVSDPTIYEDADFWREALDRV